MGDRDEILMVSLEAAVPVAIMELRGVPDEHRLARAKEYAQMIAEHGDDILFRSRRRGDTAAAFTALARGLASLAYQPGGVTFAGRHWCVNHRECEEAAR